MKESNLEKARHIINEVDMQMAELFIKRMKAAEMVAEYKTAHGLAIYDPEREEEVIRRNAERIEDATLRSHYVSFLKNNMAVSRAYQSTLMEGMKVAYCGTEGAFAHIASEKLYPSAKKIAFCDFASAYHAVENGECDIAVLPIENSYNGDVGQVIDLMFSGSLYVGGMYELPVTHDLLAVALADISDVKTVISHPQALAQCAEYIKKNGFTTLECENTALAARYVSEKNDKSIAAIGSAEAGQIFGLSVLDHDINASRSNTTRFATFSRVQAKQADNVTGLNSILLFTVRNEAGALAKAIDVIGAHGYNMRNLRSRPMKELMWEYYFYVETEGNIQSERGQNMMEELGEYCDKLKFAGTYTKL